MGDDTKWSEYQDNLFTELKEGNGSILVQALAGAGKTTTAVEASKRLDTNLRVGFAAFNKSIQLELEKRLPKNVNTKTFHAWGLGSLRKNRFPTTIEKDKTKILMEEVGCPRWQVFKYGGLIRRMVGTAKNMGMDPGFNVPFSLIPNRLYTWKKMIQKYSMLELYQELQDNEERVGDMIAIAQEILKVGSEQTTPIIDFDDMLYMPVIHGLPFDKKDVLFVDEAQDVSAIQIEIIKRSVGNFGRVVAIGDQYQCHPAGTMVSLMGGSTVSIEDIEVGQKVVTYHDCFRGLKTQGREVLGKNSREYQGLMVELDNSDKEASLRMTGNHRVLTRMGKNGKDYYAVYVMEYGNSSRLGSCRLMYENGNGYGPGLRCRQEGADRCWVLQVFKSKEDALIYESKMSLKYGILEHIFKDKGLYKDRILKEVIGDNRDRLESILMDHNLMIEYPAYERETKKKVGRNYSYLEQACNLIDGISLVRTFDGTQNGGEWEPIKKKSYYLDESVTVYSLSVEPTESGYRLYVADGVVVHNSIYGWRGAGTGSMDDIADTFNSMEMKLPICYRCGENIIKKAQKYVPDLIWHPPTGQGSIDHWGDDYDFDDFKNGDFILCRNKAPLVDLAFKLKSRGARVSIVGKDIGQQVIAFIRSLKANSIDELKGKLDEWWNKKKKYFKKIGAVQGDSVDNFKMGLKFITYSDARDVNSLIREIESFFTDKRNVYGLTLSTIHKAKGLEAERVFILNADLMPSKYAKEDWEKEQEDNLHYVAITRAQDSLNYFEYKNNDAISTRIDEEVKWVEEDIKEQNKKPKLVYKEDDEENMTLDAKRMCNEVTQVEQGG